MRHTNRFQTALLAASIALALGSTAVMAAAPTATQLPGAGTVKLGTATGGTITAGAQTITFTGNTVINWGAAGGTINATTQPAGFNVGSSANLGFTDSAAAGLSVLNVDISGNPSQIFGTLKMNAGGGNLYVANTNGIIVGATAKVSGPAQVGLIANTRGTVAFNGNAGTSSIEYQGDGGDVIVAQGATIDGASVLISGGNAVNVDLSAFKSGVATIQAGVKNSVSTLVHDNTAAVLTATGDLGGATLVGFASAGDASSSGAVTLAAGGVRVDGTLTNTGDLSLGAGFAIDGGLVNQSGTVTQTADASMGSLVNNGAYVGGGFGLTTSDGGIANSGSMTGLAAVVIQHGGDFTNTGDYASSGVLDVYGDGNVTNKGVATATGIKIREGGDFTNEGEMTLDAGDGELVVVNGNITNSGKLGAGALTLGSDSGAGLGFTASADYSVVNTGTVTSAGSLKVIANLHQGITNDSTGSFTNTGNLQVGSAGDLVIIANDDINLAGNVQAKSGATYEALSAANSLTGFSIMAGGIGFSPVLTTDGAAIIATDIVASGLALVIGNQVKLMSDVSVVDATGAPAGDLAIVAGDKQSADYAVRVASGKTMTAGTIGIGGDQAGHEPNVILQGALSAGKINLGVATLPVSDVYTGPGGSLLLHDNGFGVSLLNIAFTGAVKTVPYNNSATNFRFNGLNVTTDGSPLALGLNPVAYLTNGTSNGLSAVNLLVNSDVNLFGAPVVAPVAAGGSAVTGVTNIPNTHLVLQSSRKITTSGFGGFYWPGYVYLGNVSADADGNALPGTLGLGTITTFGDFNNVLPGDVSGASGIHFITQFPLTLGGDVVTNANAWVNFGTDLLTQGYANGTLDGDFFGGTQGPGTVINYGLLDESRFHTAPPSFVR